MKSAFLNRSKNILFYGKYIPIEYFVNQEKRLVYLPIPKVACTAIKLSVYDQELKDQKNYHDYMNIHSLLAGKQSHSLSVEEKQYYKFAFVRDPFARLVSCFKDKVIKPQQHNGRYYFDTAYNRKLIHSLYGNSFTVDMSFEEFVKLVVKIPDLFADGHFMSQTAFLYRFNKRIPDYIGKLEKIEQDWLFLVDNFGLPSLEVKNKTKKVELNEYYSDELINIVYSRYQNDIRNFGYLDLYHEIKNS